MGREAVDRCLEICRTIGFDAIEVSAGFVTVAPGDLLTLARRALDLGFQVKPEIGIQFGAGGGSSVEQLESEAPRAVDQAIRMAERYFALGIPIVMVESEGLTESVKTPRTELIAQLVASLGSERLMFEAADPAVFTWYVKNYGPDVNLFIDHSQIVQLEALRSGLWGTADIWGRVVTYQPPSENGD